VARTCLTYLNSRPFPLRVTVHDFRKAEIYTHSSCIPNSNHARESENDPRACDLTLNWLLSERFTQGHDILGTSYNGWGFAVDHLPLHQACFFGLQSRALTARLLESGSKKYQCLRFQPGDNFKISSEVQPLCGSQSPSSVCRA
jgi:hypothetical protein